MKLIVNQNIFQNNAKFFQEIKENINVIEGISPDVVITKDGIPILIPPCSTDLLKNQVCKSVQTTELKNIKEYEVLTLEKALQELESLNKKIVINFISKSTTPYAQNIELINKINQTQVSDLYTVIDKFKKLKIYVSCVCHNIIFHIKNRKPTSKIGVILNAYETNYIDVDFYVFSSEMLSYPILKQQLELNKEVMVLSHESEDMVLIYDFFKKIRDIDGTKIFDNTSFITNYPLICYKVFN